MLQPMRRLQLFRGCSRESVPEVQLPGTFVARFLQGPGTCRRIAYGYISSGWQHMKDRPTPGSSTQACSTLAVEICRPEAAGCKVEVSADTLCHVPGPGRPLPGLSCVA